MKITDGSNRITRIILAAILLSFLAGGVWAGVRLATEPENRLESALGVAVAALVLVVGAWLWRRMPSIPPTSITASVGSALSGTAHVPARFAPLQPARVSLMARIRAVFAGRPRPRPTPPKPPSEVRDPPRHW